MKISNLDHLVLTVKDIDKTVAFYTSVLGMDSISFGQGRRALVFGQQKINLHQWGFNCSPRTLSSFSNHRPNRQLHSHQC